MWQIVNSLKSGRHRQHDKADSGKPGGGAEVAIKKYGSQLNAHPHVHDFRGDIPHAGHNVHTRDILLRGIGIDLQLVLIA